jgi:hypothetical protein
LEENKGSIEVIDFIFKISEQRNGMSSGVKVYIRKEELMIEII